MRMRSPASHGSFTIRFSVFDAVCALLSPWIALWIRGAPVLSGVDWTTAVIYCVISFGFSLFAFLVFRTREGMTHLFSVHDALEVAKAVLLSEFLTCIVLFSATRLDGIPRTTPLIHALILSAGMIMARAFVRMVRSESDVPPTGARVSTEHIIIIGSNRLSSLYISLLRAYAPEQYRVLAILDDRTEMIDRSIAGVRVLGTPQNILQFVEEFKEHGIRVDRIIVGGDADFLPPELMAEIERVGNEYKIKRDFVPQLIGMSRLQAPADEMQAAPQALLKPTDFSPSGYFRVKLYIDFCLSLMLIVVLLPLLIAIAIVVLIDVGSPAFFWQRRIGMNGRSFQIHKFRTLKSTFDWRDQTLSAVNRMSWIGNLLRKFRFDELPQLLNVLVGDMSLVGPRPLLAQDQPPDPTLRLMVRPGITGWAQVNGGKLLTAEEKNTLDEWYVRNASLWVDLKIIGKTILFAFQGERRHAPKAQADSARNPPNAIGGHAATSTAKHYGK
jgi:lipopolysaccharide/colanic/teichoic acid biosynthesis glycosyltransferase